MYKHLLFPLILLCSIVAACNKKVTTPDSPSTTGIDSCTCRNIMFDRYKFVNWDGSNDIADFISYSIEDSFKNPKGGYYGNPIDADGYIEGVLLTPFSGTQYKIRFRNNPRTYYVKNYAPHVDLVECDILNDSIECFSSYSITINDSIINVPRRIINTHGSQTDTLFFY